MGRRYHAMIAGIDEAGRGPLAGPVVVAAVILDESRPPIEGLTDSKRLSARKRADLAAQIHAEAVATAVVQVDVDEIDRLNILGATLAGMQRTVCHLLPRVSRAVIDGNRCPDLPIPAKAIVGGDGLVPAISAASILAKVARDRYMVELAAVYPGYGFEQHKGYGTRAHLAALRRLGPCPAHRHSFAPVRAARDQLALPFEAGPDHIGKGKQATP